MGQGVSADCSEEGVVKGYRRTPLVLRNCYLIEVRNGNINMKKRIAQLYEQGSGFANIFPTVRKQNEVKL